MLLDIDPYIDISGHRSRVLVALPVEDVVMGIGYTLLDSYFDHLFALFDSFALASFASIGLVDYYTESAAGFARGLNLSVHSRTKLGKLHSNT